MKEKMLRINLSSGKFREEEIPDEVLRNYFGGICLGAKILFEELKPGIDALSPDNKLVFSAGLLTGVPFFANARYVAMAKSPLTNLWGHANSGGYFGPELRAAGYIALIIEGKARNPVYILIKDGGVEVRDARKIWGKFTGDVVDEIKKETGDERIRVACIGPAAEKLVRYACIINDYHHAAGRSGLGTVMASKNLKAVAVRGSKRVEIPNREAFTSIVK
ncbi:MAG: aldehyde ferredoxin oxidoreductase, partial [Crenarchaeota archaeon]|nr:aldehyde ferredoxin oxidoreductase [Thermoproteota archaeon]